MNIHLTSRTPRPLQRNPRPPIESTPRPENTALKESVKWTGVGLSLISSSYLAASALNATVPEELKLVPTLISLVGTGTGMVLSMQDSFRTGQLDAQTAAAGVTVAAGALSSSIGLMLLASKI